MLKTNTSYIGDEGERAAAKYMQENGYSIIETNYHSKFGEIDIIAKNSEYVVFVEVKARKSTAYGSPCEFVDFRKQQKIIKTAYKYIAENNIEAPLRFDVCEIIHKPGAGGKIVLSSINYIEGAFET